MKCKRCGSTEQLEKLWSSTGFYDEFAEEGEPILTGECVCISCIDKAHKL